MATGRVKYQNEEGDLDEYEIAAKKGITIGMRQGTLTVTDVSSADYDTGTIIHLRCDCGVRRIVGVQGVWNMRRCDEAYCSLIVMGKDFAKEKAKQEADKKQKKALKQERARLAREASSQMPQDDLK